MAQQIINIGDAPNDGTGEPLRQAFDAVNNNFTEIYTAGPVGSNVVITGNTITVTGVNNNLVLKANGIGNIQANSSIIPSIDGVYDIGAPAQRIDTVYAQYFVGNGSGLTGITTAGTSLDWGSSNVKIVSAGGNVTVSVGGTSNVAVFSTGGANVRGNITSTGNIRTSGAGGNITGANVIAGVTVSAFGNIVGQYFLGNGALLTGINTGNANSIVNGTSNVLINTANGNVAVSVRGIANTVVFGNTSTTFTGNLLPIANNVGNLGSPFQRWNTLWLSGNTIRLGESTITSGGGDLTLTNPYGGQLIVSGYGITSSTQLANGSSNIGIAQNNGNVTVGVGGTSNALVVSSSGAYILGNVNSANVNASANISATGNITVSGVVTTGASGNIDGANYVHANYFAGISTSVSGNITAGNITVSTGTVRLGNIVNANGNAIGNIGSSGVYFNTLFARATSAIYADLAEYYSADAEYDPGTVLSFGGNNEVTMTTAINDIRVAGVVSTNPAHAMNAGIEAKHSVALALAGRVPTLVVGPVVKGDMMVSAGGGRAKACATPVMGTVIGKAVENHPGGQGVIEVVVGKL